jgi:hypothetical protein
MARGYAVSSHRHGERSRDTAYAATRKAMPACSEGIAATLLPTPPSNRLRRSMPMSSQPRPVIRGRSAGTGPYREAHHGGAMGYTT